MHPDNLPDRTRPAHPPSVEINRRATIYFVTACTKDRRPLLATDSAHQIIKAAWLKADSYRVGRYVILPDHLHLFCSPATTSPPALAQWMRHWRATVAKTWPHDLRPPKLWQRDYWDTQLRKGDSYSAKWEYVLQNPIRAGLVHHPAQWPHQGELHTLLWTD
ncbi:transposase [soil metagenome]